VKELPIAQDIPRLARKIFIYDKNKEMLNFIQDSNPVNKVIAASSPTSTLSKQDSSNSIDAEKASTPTKVNDPVLSRIIFSILQTLSHELPDLQYVFVLFHGRAMY